MNQPLSPDEKDQHRKLGHAYNRLAAISAGITAIAALFTGPTSLLFPALASAGFWLQSDVETEIAEDPPDKEYKKRVRIRSRRLHLPHAPTSEAATFRKVFEESVFLRQVSRALLRAAERLGGAIGAGDNNYIELHRHDLKRIQHTYLSTHRHALKSIEEAAKTLEASRQFADLTTTEVQRVLAKTLDELTPGKFLADLRSAGLTKSESERYGEWFYRQEWAKEIRHPLERDIFTAVGLAREAVGRIEKLSQ